MQKQLEPPDKIAVRGQIQSKDQAFLHIGIGLIVAMVAVYLLMALNYQTWGDPFVVLAALPLAFCGIVASLFITQTSFSIPSLMGAIMSVGVASANSILLVTFAREHRERDRCQRRGSGDRGRRNPAAAGADDRRRDVRRPAADGDRHRRGQRAERRPGPRRARRDQPSAPARPCCSCRSCTRLLRRGEAKPLEDYI